MKAHALPQVQGYVTDLLAAAGRKTLSGKYVNVPYDWNLTSFHVGMGDDWPGKLRLPLPNFPMVDLVADYAGNGTVLYWLEPNAAAVIPIVVPSRRLVKPQNWLPGNYAPQPVVISLSEACGYTLIMVGSVIIIATVAEDVATLGAGTFDDAVTVPAGILFINYGQRLGVIIPAYAP